MPKESSLDTVAGVHASMATIEQATMPYAISAFLRWPVLRNEARPILSVTEISAANDCSKAVAALLERVDEAVSKLSRVVGS